MTELKPTVYKAPGIRVTETEQRIEIETLTFEELCSIIPELTDSKEAILSGGCTLSGSYPNYTCDNNGSCSNGCEVVSSSTGNTTSYACKCKKNE